VIYQDGLFCGIRLQYVSTTGEDSGGLRRTGEDIISYEAAVRGGLQLVPDGAAEELLATDYADMVSDGLVFESAPDFTTLVAHAVRFKSVPTRPASVVHGRQVF
jgi:hypothetical protein